MGRVHQKNINKISIFNKNFNLLRQKPQAPAVGRPAPCRTAGCTAGCTTGPAGCLGFRFIPRTPYNVVVQKLQLPLRKWTFTYSTLYGVRGWWRYDGSWTSKSAAGIVTENYVPIKKLSRVTLGWCDFRISKMTKTAAMEMPGFRRQNWDWKTLGKIVFFLFLIRDPLREHSRVLFTKRMILKLEKTSKKSLKLFWKHLQGLKNIESWWRFVW